MDDKRRERMKGNDKRLTLYKFDLQCQERGVGGDNKLG